jgi:hypothetical protein
MAEPGSGPGGPGFADPAAGSSEPAVLIGVFHGDMGNSQQDNDKMYIDIVGY